MINTTKIISSLEITKIYLITNCYNDPNQVYIGKTKGSRKYKHIKTYGVNINYTYIDEVNSLKHEDWQPLETFWINYFKFLGFKVLNKNNGGGGCSKMSFESKTKIGLNNMKPKPEGFMSNEHKAKISQANKGKKLSDNHIFKLSLIHKDKILSDEQKLKMYTSERNVKISDSLKGMPKSNTHKDNIATSKLNIPTKKSTSVIQYDLEGNIMREWDKIDHALKYYNKLKSNSSITLCCRNKIKSAFGFIWRYKI